MNDPHNGPHLAMFVPFTPERIEKVADKLGLEPEDVTAGDLQRYVLLVLEEAEK